jgi:hypothetical protein
MIGHVMQPVVNASGRLPEGAALIGRGFLGMGMCWPPLACPSGLQAKLFSPVPIELRLDERNKLFGLVRVELMDRASKLLDEIDDAIRLMLVDVARPHAHCELVHLAQKLELPVAGLIEAVDVIQPTRQLPQERPKHFLTY